MGFSPFFLHFADSFSPIFFPIKMGNSPFFPHFGFHGERNPEWQLRARCEFGVGPRDNQPIRGKIGKSVAPQAPQGSRARGIEDSRPAEPPLHG